MRKCENCGHVAQYGDEDIYLCIEYKHIKAKCKSKGKVLVCSEWKPSKEYIKQLEAENKALKDIIIEAKARYDKYCDTDNWFDFLCGQDLLYETIRRYCIDEALGVSE